MDHQVKLQRARCAIASHGHYLNADKREQGRMVIVDALHMARNRGIDTDELILEARERFEREAQEVLRDLG